MNFRFLGSLNAGPVATAEKLDVILGTASSITPGDLVIPDDGNPGYVKYAPNATTSVTATRVYLAVSTSTETAAADGQVEAIYCRDMVLEGTSATPANLLQAVIDTKVALDESAGVQKIDENDTTNGFMRIKRPAGGASEFDTTNGIIQVIVNE